MRRRNALLCFLSVVVLCTSTVGHAAAKKATCDKDYKQLESSLYSILTSSAIKDADEQQFRETLAACHQKAASGSAPDLANYSNLLQTLTNRVETSITFLTPQVIQASPSQEAKENIKKLQTVRQDLLTEIMTVDRSGGTGWDKDFDANFYIGYEGTNVSGFKDKTTSRLGMSVYNQMFGPLERSDQGGWGWHPNLFLSGDIMMSSAVTSSATGTQELASGTTNTAEVSSSLGAVINAFAPLFTRKQDSGTLAFGPIASFEFVKPDNVSQFTKSFVYGFRAANNPYTYFDFLYGRVQGISHDRIEVRGQYRVGEVMNGNVLVGGLANMTSNVFAKNTETDTEWLKVYIMWQVAISDFYTK